MNALNAAALLRWAASVGTSVEQALRAMHGVVSATLTTGEFDYTLRVAVGDEAELVNLVEELRANGVAQTQSRIILRETVFR